MEARAPAFGVFCGEPPSMSLDDRSSNDQAHAEAVALRRDVFKDSFLSAGRPTPKSRTLTRTQCRQSVAVESVTTRCEGARFASHHRR